MSEDFEPYSAGLIPGVVDPRAIKVMNEIGIDISGQRSKHVEEFIDMPFDLVVTVCDYAKENCPVLPAVARTVHIPFRDPIDAVGTGEEILQVFRDVRDQIKDQIPKLLKSEFPA
jgi:arsenate reductase